MRGLLTLVEFQGVAVPYFQSEDPARASIRLFNFVKCTALTVFGLDNIDCIIGLDNIWDIGSS